MDRNENHKKIARLTSLALLTAIVVVLQLIGSSFRIGPIPFSLVLVPIVIGAILLGPWAGAFLGAVFGVMTLAGGIGGSDVFTAALWSFSPFWTAATCLLKGAACGAVAGLVYRALAKKQTLACILAAVVCPIVNTGVFALVMLTALRTPLMQMAAVYGWAGSAVTVLFVTVIGVNFFVEFGINAVLSAAIARIIKAVQRS